MIVFCISIPHLWEKDTKMKDPEPNDKMAHQGTNDSAQCSFILVKSNVYIK
jgi:hypothetical protein